MQSELQPITIKGYFKGNTIITDDNIKYNCITYGTVLDAIIDKSGFFNLRKFNKTTWVVFQYLLD